MDWTVKYIETENSERSQYLWVSLFYYMAKTAIDDYGLEGDRCIRQAVREFGHERGIRRRQRADAQGMPADLISLKAITDIYRDPRFAKVSSAGKKRFHQAEPQQEFTKVYTCPNADMWAELEGKKLGEYQNIGSIYCEEVHHHLYGDFDPATQVNLTDILTKGDECCNFRLHLRKANMQPFDAGKYEPQSWEDFGTNAADSIYTMFCLHFYHYAKGVYEKLGEAELRKIISIWATERGLRLRELNRRNNVANDVDTLVNKGDLFLDSRIVKRIDQLNADNGRVLVTRSIMCQLLHDHGADYLAPIYLQESMKALCNAYNPAIQVDVRNVATEGCGGYELILNK